MRKLAKMGCRILADMESPRVNLVKSFENRADVNCMISLICGHKESIGERILLYFSQHLNESK